MGIHDFSQVVREAIKHFEGTPVHKEINILKLTKSVFIFDGNALVIRLGNNGGLHSDHERNAFTISAALDLFERLRRNDNVVIVASDLHQAIDASLTVEGKLREFKSQNSHLTSVIDAKDVAEGHAAAKASSVTTGGTVDIGIEMSATAESSASLAAVMDAKVETQKKRREALARTIESGHDVFRLDVKLLRALEEYTVRMGIPFFRCALESDALMACLAEDLTKGEHVGISLPSWAMVDTDAVVAGGATAAAAVAAPHAPPIYIVTEDSDMFVYNLGNAHLLRRCAVTGRVKGRYAYEDFDLPRFWEQFGDFNLGARARFPLFMKCDYFNAIAKVGPKTVLKYLCINSNGGMTPTSAYIDMLLANQRVEPEDLDGGMTLSEVAPLSYITSIAKKAFVSPTIGKRYTVSELYEIRRSKRLVAKKEREIDMVAYDRLDADGRNAYSAALFRFTFGARIERSLRAQSGSVMTEAELSIMMNELTGKPDHPVMYTKWKDSRGDAVDLFDTTEDIVDVSDTSDDDTASVASTVSTVSVGSLMKKLASL